MSRIKGKNTKPEIELRSALHKAGFRYRLHSDSLPGKPDIVFSSRKTVIFVHGCYWHRHAECRYAYMPKSNQSFWINKFAATVLRDERKAFQLEELGWRVLTVWECEISEALPQVVQRLTAALQSGAGKPAVN